MTNMDFENYFNTNEDGYYDAKIMITILEDIMGKPIEEIRQDVNNKQITVTRRQIENYLERRFAEEEPELKERISKPINRRSKYIANFDEQNIQVLEALEFKDTITALKYQFEPYTLEYFDKYTTIVRNKINLLLDIINKIIIKDTTSIQETLTDLDIMLDQNGDILRDDIIRLIIPIIYNMNELDAKVSQGNNLETYLNYKMSESALARDGISENELYPTKKIQIKSLTDGHTGNIPLSKHQKNKLKKRLKKSMKKTAEMLLS